MTKTIIILLLLCIVPVRYNTPLEIEEDNLKEFYFPISELSEPKVYMYSNIFDENQILYWRLEASSINNRSLLTTTVFNQDFSPIEIFQEHIGAKGSEIVEYNLFIDSEKIQAQLTDRDVFKWKQEKNSSISWSIQYPVSDGAMKISKTRNYYGYKTIRTIGDKEHKTVKFRDDFNFTLMTDNKEDQFRYHQDSYYASGTGMIEYIRYSGENLVHYKLEKILSEDNWLTLIDKK